MHHLPRRRGLVPRAALTIGVGLVATLGCSAPTTTTAGGAGTTSTPAGTVVVASPDDPATAQIGCLSTGTTTPGTTTAPTAGESVTTAPVSAVRAAPSPSTAATAPAPGSPAVWAEIQHELSTYTSSDYQHTTTLDRADGTYVVDCSGWGDVLLRIAACDAYGDLVRSANARRGTTFSTSCELGTGTVEHGPYAVDWATMLTGLAPGASDGHWTRVATVAELQPGDVVTYALAPGADDTGHVMFVAGPPTVDPQDPTQWRVPIADSTSSEHGPDDSRKGNPRNTDGKGIGQAAIELLVDATGAPTDQFRWYPGAPLVDQIPAPVVLGRLG